MRRLSVTIIRRCLVANVFVYLYQFISLPSFAQVSGTFYPSVYGDTAYQPLQAGISIPETIPFFQRKILQLDSDLEQQQRPYIGLVSSLCNEPLSSYNAGVTTQCEGLEGGFFPNRQTQVQFDFLPTLVGLKNPLTKAFQYVLSVRNQPTDRLKLFSSLGLVHTFGDVPSGLGLIGSAGISYAVTDRISLNADYLRDIVGDSRMSIAGVTIPGTSTLVGRVKRNRFSVGISLRPMSRTNIDFKYGLGFYQGHNVSTNILNEFNFRVGQTLVAREPGAHLQFLQPSFQLLALGFTHDDSGFGNASLIPPSTLSGQIAQLASIEQGQISPSSVPGALSAASVGGYFSPQIFYSTSLRIDAQGRFYKSLFYRIGAGLGTQNFKNSSTSLGQTGLIGAANVALIARLSKHVAIEQGWYFIQAANTYQRNIIYNQMRYFF